MDTGFAAHHLLVLLLALLIDRLIGYPDRLFRLIKHPVVWFGALLNWCDGSMNKNHFGSGWKYIFGWGALACLLAVTALVTVPAAIWLRGSSWGVIAEAVLVASLLSQKSLSDHVRAVAIGLGLGLAAGRDAVKHIVGRDPAMLDEPAIARAAIESLGENTSDGVMAPVFWFLFAGLPGIALYKAVNTADSMIGYKSDKYLEFGFAAARLDDVLNFIPARLSAVGFALTRPGRFREILKITRRDAGKHVSPNAGWPETALAAALDIRLGGPRSYDGRIVDLPWLGEGRTELTVDDIDHALKLFARLVTGCAVLIGVLFLGTVLT